MKEKTNFTVLDDEGNVIEQKDTTLIVNEVSKAKKPLNILCIVYFF